MSELTINQTVPKRHAVANIFDALKLPNGPKEWHKVSLVKRINQALALVGKNQKERADILGVSQSVISNIERYELAGISVERLLRYAKLLGIADLEPEMLPLGNSHEN